MNQNTTGLALARHCGTAATTAATTTAGFTSAAELQRLRATLLRRARALVRNDDDAADAVQETLLAALQAPQHFAGRSSLSTWLTGILRHKVADVFRHKARVLPLAVPAAMAGDDDNQDDDALDALFNADGGWREPLLPWPEPLAALSSKRFEQLLDECLAQLPPKAARVFRLRELAGLDTQEICAALDITENHCCVLMYRARLKLRELLQAHWDGG